MKIKNSLLLLICLGILASCSKQTNQVKSYIGFGIQKENLDQFLQAKMEEKQIPGMAIAFINKGEIIHHQTWGYANLEKQLPVSKSTIFEAASLSKSVFAYFVMKYVDSGQLDLDRPLYNYLPYPDIADDERYKKITARMVLSHRSGFPNWRTDYPEKKLFIQFEPGTDYHYSGEGYQYLAKVLKEIEQTDWDGLEKAFQEKVAQPLGLEHTVFIQDAYSKENKAEPYDENRKWISPDIDPDSLRRFQFFAPASIHSEAVDFSKWMIGLMNDQGLTQQSFEELYGVHSYVGNFDAVDMDYTLGFFKPRLPLTNILMHGGNNFGFTSFFAMDPQKDWGFVLFTNSEYGEDLGLDLLLFMLAGPDMYKVYLVLGLFVLFILIALFFLGKFAVKRLNKIKKE